METFFSEKFYFVGRRLIIIIPGKSGRFRYLVS